MSTTVGNGLTVDGTVKASQATQAGEAVVLGDDGLVPQNLIGESSGMNQREFSNFTDLLTAVSNGEIPPYAKAVLEGYIVTNVKFIVIVDYLSSTHRMPCKGPGQDASDHKCIDFFGIDSNSKLYYNSSYAGMAYNVTKATAFWRD